MPTPQANSRHRGSLHVLRQQKMHCCSQLKSRLGAGEIVPQSICSQKDIGLKIGAYSIWLVKLFMCAPPTVFLLEQVSAAQSRLSPASGNCARHRSAGFLTCACMLFKRREWCADCDQQPRLAFTQRLRMQTKSGMCVQASAEPHRVADQQGAGLLSGARHRHCLLPGRAEAPHVSSPLTYHPASDSAVVAGTPLLTISACLLLGCSGADIDC